MKRADSIKNARRKWQEIKKEFSSGDDEGVAFDAIYDYDQLDYDIEEMLAELYDSARYEGFDDGFDKGYEMSLRKKRN